MVKKNAQMEVNLEDCWSHNGSRTQTKLKKSYYLSLTNVRAMSKNGEFSFFLRVVDDNKVRKFWGL